MWSSRPLVWLLLILESASFTLVLGQVYLDPTVNPVDIQIINNLTDAVVTAITDVEYVFLRYNASSFGVTLYNMRACDDDLCSNYDVQLIDNNGCPVVFSGVGSIIPTGFVRDSVNPELYETNPFKLFRWDNGNTLYLKGQIDICETSAAVCNDKCTASSTRRKRDVTPVRRVDHSSSSYVITGQNGKDCTIHFNKDIETVDVYRSRSPANAVQAFNIEWTESGPTFYNLLKTYLTDNEKCKGSVLQSIQILCLLTFLTTSTATVLTLLRTLVL